MHVFHCNLGAVEALSFGCHYFGGKIAAQFLVDDAIRGSKERKNLGDKVAFIGRYSVPICDVCWEVNLFHCPEGCFSFHLHPPDVDMVDGEEHKAVWISCSSGSGARISLPSVVFCFDSCLGGVGAFSAFYMVRAVLVQNLFQSLPLLQMKLVISQKAWYVTTSWMGMVWYGEGKGVCV